MNKIKEIAKEKNMTIQEIIEKSRISKTHMYDIINERKSPTLRVAEKIAKTLDVNLSELFPLKED